MTTSLRPDVSCILIALLALAPGCQRTTAPEKAISAHPPASHTGGNDATANQEQAMKTIDLTSPAFAAGAAINKQYTGEGKDVSPPLKWRGVPEGTRELALICDDPDAPSPQPWVHWVIYKIPADHTELPAGISRDAQHADSGIRQGRNSWPSENVGYRGPMPPPGHGTHRYFFKLYALDAELDLPPGQPDKDALLAAMKGHVLATGELMATYERK